MVLPVEIGFLTLQLPVQWLRLPCHIPSGGSVDLVPGPHGVRIPYLGVWSCTKDGRNPVRDLRAPRAACGKGVVAGK